MHNNNSAHSDNNGTHQKDLMSTDSAHSFRFLFSIFQTIVMMRPAIMRTWFIIRFLNTNIVDSLRLIQTFISFYFILFLVKFYDATFCFVLNLHGFLLQFHYFSKKYDRYSCYLYYISSNKTHITLKRKMFYSFS